MKLSTPNTFFNSSARCKSIGFRRQRRDMNMHGVRCWGRASFFVFATLCLVNFVDAYEDVFHHNHDHDHDHNNNEICGTEIPSLQQEMINQVRLNAFGAVTDGTYDRRRKLQTESCDELCKQCIEIEVYLHLIGTDLGFGPVIPHPQSALSRSQENVDDVTIEDFATAEEIIAMFEENIDVVNKAFLETPFRFKFMSEHTTQTTNVEWSEASVDFKDEIGALLGNQDLRKLDCFVSSGLRPTRGVGEILGTATLPASQSVEKGDGVYIRYDVLPGGGRAKNDMGFTLVHEIGVSVKLFKKKTF